MTRDEALCFSARCNAIGATSDALTGIMYLFLFSPGRAGFYLRCAVEQGAAAACNYIGARFMRAVERPDHA